MYLYVCYILYAIQVFGPKFQISLFVLHVSSTPFFCYSIKQTVLNDK
jgi:hypothetical protein